MKSSEFLMASGILGLVALIVHNALYERRRYQ
jgi:hypothetical protein